MSINLDQIVKDYAQGMKLADSRYPVAISQRSGESYQAGIVPHTESQTTNLVFQELSRCYPFRYSNCIYLEVPYLGSRSRCDVCIGEPNDWEWAIEIKMLRLMGDNGKPNDNILMHILSPYPAQRSALTDCTKLLESNLGKNKAIFIYAYDYDGWPVEPAIEAFEVLASRRVKLIEKFQTSIDNLIHPIHQRAKVFGWSLNLI
jgi:hypothetical protein